MGAYEEPPCVEAKSGEDVQGLGCWLRYSNRCGEMEVPCLMNPLWEALIATGVPYPSCRSPRLPRALFNLCIPQTLSGMS